MSAGPALFAAFAALPGAHTEQQEAPGNLDSDPDVAEVNPAVVKAFHALASGAKKSQTAKRKLYAGPLWRSAQSIHAARLCIGKTKKSKSFKRLEQTYDKVAKAWNKKQLRYGDCLLTAGEVLAPRKSLKGPRGNQWRAEGLQWHAYGTLGSGSGARGEAEVALGKTHRSAELAAVVAQASLKCQATELQKQCLSFHKKDSFIAMVVNRNYDATPIRVKFGGLQDKIAPFARYFAQDANQRWKSVPLDDYMAARRGPKPRFGV